jgi:hypothetical protein
MADGGITGRQWIREGSFTISGKTWDIVSLRAQFMVRQKDSQHPNWMYIRITNLSDDSMNHTYKENDIVELKAGYPGRSGVIFKGKVMQVRKGKEPNGVDKYFDVLATSNNQAYGFAMVNKTLKAGWTNKDILEEALKPMKAFGVEEGHVADLGSKKGTRAKVLFGHPREILRDLAFSTGTSWSIQDEKFQMLKPDGYLPGQVVVLNSTTGMIGLPEQNLKGIVVKSLLNPEFHYGGRVKIDESSIQKMLFTAGNQPGSAAFQESVTPTIAPDGIYRILRVDHDGDSEGQDWYSTLTCTNASDGLRPGQDPGEGASPVKGGNAGEQVWRGTTETEDDEQGGGRSGGEGQ